MVEHKKPLSNDSSQALYSCGYQFYRNGKYTEALEVFRTLTVMQPDAQRNWIGLAASYQMNKEYERALEAYAFAAALEENNPMPHLHAAECLDALGRYEEASKALVSAEMSANETKNKEVLKHIELIRDVWKRRKK